MEQKITIEEILINDREKELIEKTQKIIENVKNNEYNSIKFGIFERQIYKCKNKF